MWLLFKCSSRSCPLIVIEEGRAGCTEDQRKVTNNIHGFWHFCAAVGHRSCPLVPTTSDRGIVREKLFCETRRLVIASPTSADAGGRRPRRGLGPPRRRPRRHPADAGGRRPRRGLGPPRRRPRRHPAVTSARKRLRNTVLKAQYSTKFTAELTVSRKSVISRTLRTK